MGYYPKKLNNKKGRQWKLQFVDYTKTPPKTDDISDNLGNHGFSETMTLEEAQQRAKILNKDAEIKRRAAAKIKINTRLEEEKIQLAVSFPDESDFLKWMSEQYRSVTSKNNKFDSHWHCTKKIIAELKLKPTEYSDNKAKIYRWFQDNKLSISYLQKVLRLLNLYAQFYSKKYKTYYEQVPMPKGYNRSDIEDSYFEANPEGNTAKELTPILLEQSESKLRTDLYNWLYLSMWLGLRPSEVDALKNPLSYKIETQNDVTVIWVYQSKLKSISRDKRWKPIPLIEKEQLKVLEIIKSNDFKKPYPKSIKLAFGDGYNLYSGRKGFEAVMRDRGQKLEDVSQWLGHRSIERTWRNYVNKGVVRFTKKPA